MDYNFETVWIVGASSGIGMALAKELDACGAKLILSARRETELEKLNQELGTRHLVLPLDVSDQEQVAACINKIKDLKINLNRMVYLAAIYQPGLFEEVDLNFAHKLIHINLLGAMYVTKAVLPLFHELGKGQVAICASSAGFIGMPAGQPYSCTKAALINFAESLYCEMPKYIDVKVINPGFVKTPMTDLNKFRMPGRISAQKAAKHIAKGLKKRSFEIHFPKFFTTLTKIIRLLPYPIHLFLISKLKNEASKT